MRGNLLVTGGLLLLCGCGGSDKSSEGGESALAAEPEAAAAPAAKAPDLDCDKFTPQTAPQGQPADDILGLRHGMTEEQVRGILLCDNANYAINTSKTTISLPEGGQMSRVDLNADTGLDKVNVWLLGPAGVEKVVHVDRIREFPAGKELPVDNISQELDSKYSVFDDTTSYFGRKSGNIVRSRDGQKIDSSNSSYGECSSHSIRADKVLPCMHVISYEVMASQQNPALASRFAVAVTSFAMMAQMATATTQQQAKAVERAKETVEANGLDL